MQVTAALFEKGGHDEPRSIQRTVEPVQRRIEKEVGTIH
jgi:hypothetical protein